MILRRLILLFLPSHMFLIILTTSILPRQERLCLQTLVQLQLVASHLLTTVTLLPFPNRCSPCLEFEDTFT